MMQLTRKQNDALDIRELNYPPATPEEKASLSVAMDDYIRQSIDAALQPKDRQSLGRNARSVPDDKARSRIEDALDILILKLAPTYGCRLFYSDLVLSRLAAWMDGDEVASPAKFEKLGKQLRRGALFLRGTAKLPVGPDERRFKETMKNELGNLQRLLRARQVPMGRSLHGAISGIVHRDDHPFPGLLDNWTSFEELTTKNPNMLPAFATGGLTPTLFIDQWIAAARNRSSVESVRQNLTQAHQRSRPRRK